MLLARTIATKSILRHGSMFTSSHKVVAYGVFNNTTCSNATNPRKSLNHTNNFQPILPKTYSSVLFYSKTLCTCKLFLCSQNQKNFLSLTPRSSKEDDDDLRAILKDKSLGLTQKFKIIFRQYGVVMIVVHLLTSVVWVAIFYYIISRGFDINPLLERWGVFDYLKSWGFSFADKLKSSGASDYVATYALYELAKPIRYIVTLFGTMYAVRYLRRKGLMKQPPKSATVSDLMQTQSKIMRNRLRTTTKNYSDKYHNRLNHRKKNQRNGVKNGTSK